MATGDWLLLLNPDTSVSPGFLDTVLDRADDLVDLDARAGIVGFRLANDDGSLQLSTGRFPTLASTLIGRLWPRCSRKYTHPIQPGRAQVDWVTGCCMLIRRDCWRDLGGFDPNYFLYYEDVDLCRRARSRGWSVWYDPAVTVTHHRPLHTRRVPPHLRLITRHALLTYARKHWTQWQADVMARVVGTEAWLGANAELADLVNELQRGDETAAQARITRVVRLYEEGRASAPVHCHPIAQSARLAWLLPGQRSPARAVGH